MFDYYNILLPAPLRITQAEVPCLSLSLWEPVLHLIHKLPVTLIFSCGFSSPFILLKTNTMNTDITKAFLLQIS